MCDRVHCDLIGRHVPASIETELITKKALCVDVSSLSVLCANGSMAESAFVMVSERSTFDSEVR